MRRRQIGKRSRRSTIRCVRSCRRRSSISIARWPTAWPSARDAGLTLIDEIEQVAVLRNYAPLPAAKGDFLFRAGRLAEAKIQFERAAALTRNEREKAFLLARAAACGG